MNEFDEDLILTNCFIERNQREQQQQQKNSFPPIDFIEYKPLNPFTDFDKQNPKRLFYLFRFSSNT